MVKMQNFDFTQSAKLAGDSAQVFNLTLANAIQVQNVLQKVFFFHSLIDFKLPLRLNKAATAMSKLIYVARLTLTSCFPFCISDEFKGCQQQLLLTNLKPYTQL